MASRRSMPHGTLPHMACLGFRAHQCPKLVVVVRAAGRVAADAVKQLLELCGHGALARQVRLHRQP